MIININKNNKINILCYVVSFKHLLNLKILFNTKKFNLTCIYEKNLKLIDERKFKELGYNYISYYQKTSLENILKKKLFNFYFLSTTPLRKLPIKLITSALIKKIPTFSVQEVHQMYLHEGTINNYMIELDRLFVSSAFEAKEYYKLGYKAENIDISGWPFLELNYLEKQKFNKNLLLIVTGSNLINPFSRYDIKKFKEIVSIIINSKLFTSIDIKLHPNEDIKIAKKLKYYFKRKISIINQDNLNLIINDYKFLVCDSTSQSLLEALYLNKRPLIYNAINKNLINDIEKNIFFNNLKTFKDAIRLINNSDDSFNKIKKNILYISPNDARKKIEYQLFNFKFYNESKNINKVIDIKLWNLLINNSTNIKTNKSTDDDFNMFSPKNF